MRTAASTALAFSTPSSSVQAAWNGAPPSAEFGCCISHFHSGSPGSAYTSRRLPRMVTGRSGAPAPTSARRSTSATLQRASRSGGTASSPTHTVTARFGTASPASVTVSAGRGVSKGRDGSGHAQERSTNTAPRRGATASPPPTKSGARVSLAPCPGENASARRACCARRAGRRCVASPPGAAVALRVAFVPLAQVASLHERAERPVGRRVLHRRPGARLDGGSAAVPARAA